MSSPRNILLLSATSDLGGAEKVLLSCAKFLNPQKYNVILLAQSIGPLTEEFKNLGKDVIFEPLPAWRKMRNIVSRYWTVYKLLNIIKQRNISLLHCNAFRLVPYINYCAKLAKVPAFVHLHDCLTLRQKKAYFLEKAPAILAVSECVRQPFAKSPLRTEKIYMGIPSHEQNGDDHFRKEFNIAPDVWVLGMIANFTENKRPEKFLEIAAAVKHLHPQMRCVIVGHNAWHSGITAEVLQKKAQALGIAEELILTGWRDDVGQILPNFDALIVPSLKEAFSLVVLEAKAARVVVFAHKHAGGPTEQIRDGNDGFLVDCNEPTAVAERIVSVLVNSTLKHNITEAAFQRVQSEFSMAIFIQQLETFYNSFFVQSQN